ncbi:MAG: hypothetical protein MJ212_04620, partial [Alphaproteobacteria bacterium]|nr:hypothetical protein [Alphaproteobacteria bacterium]
KNPDSTGTIIFEDIKDKMRRKMQVLHAQNKTKSSSWLNEKLNKFNEFTQQRFGTTPVEFAKNMFGYFSTRRGIVNTLASTALVATAAYSIPAGLAAMAAYGVYQSLAPSQWTIYEKKKAYYDAAKARGDKKEIKVWSGINGLRNAYKAIKANHKEKAKFDRQKKTNMAFGLASAAVVGLATPIIVGGGAVFGLTGAAALYGTKAIASAVRLTGANVNAYVQMKDAKKQAKEDKESNSENAAKSENAYKKAKFFLGFGILSTAISEFAMANSAAEAYHADYALGVEHNPENVSPVNEQHNFADVEKVVDNVDSSSNTEIEIPQQYDETMGLTLKQWETAHATGKFDEQYLNVSNLQKVDPDAFINSDGTEIDPSRFVYMANRIMSMSKAYPDGHGGYIAHLYDENHVEVFANGEGGYTYIDGSQVTSNDIAPECWGTEEEVATFRAIYKTVDCGKSADSINNSTFNELYSKIGGNRSAYMNRDDCGEVHFVRGAIHRIARPAPAPEPTPVPEPAPIPEPVPDAVIDETEVVPVTPDAVIDETYVTNNVVGGNTPVEAGSAAGPNSNELPTNGGKPVVLDSLITKGGNGR